MLPTVISARAILPSVGQACPKTVTFKFKISVPAAGTYTIAYGPPRWIYSEFMKKNNLIGNTRLATIGNVLEWARQNLTHFYGDDTYQNCFDIWQYYGFPPISSIIAGTTDPNDGFAHWTAGCHGSLGFYTAYKSWFTIDLAINILDENSLLVRMLVK